jgi:hypothetical protein
MDDGLDLVFVASDAAPLSGDAACRAAAPREKGFRDSPWFVLAIVLVIGVGLFAVVGTVVRLRR